jgi:hypothetical protein
MELGRRIDKRTQALLQDYEDGRKQLWELPAHARGIVQQLGLKSGFQPSPIERTSIPAGETITGEALPPPSVGTPPTAAEIAKRRERGEAHLARKKEETAARRERLFGPGVRTIGDVMSLKAKERREANLRAGGSIGRLRQIEHQEGLQKEAVAAETAKAQAEIIRAQKEGQLTPETILGIAGQVAETNPGLAQQLIQWAAQLQQQQRQGGGAGGGATGGAGGAAEAKPNIFEIPEGGSVTLDTPESPEAGQTEFTIDAETKASLDKVKASTQGLMNEWNNVGAGNRTVARQRMRKQMDALEAHLMGMKNVHMRKKAAQDILNSLPPASEDAGQQGAIRAWLRSIATKGRPPVNPRRVR